MDPQFATRVAATLPKETLFLHTYFPGDHGGMLELPRKQMLNVCSSTWDGSALLQRSMSSDGGETWEEPRPILDLDGIEIPGASPTLMRLESGRIGLLYAKTA